MLHRCRHSGYTVTTVPFVRKLKASGFNYAVPIKIEEEKVLFIFVFYIS